MRKRLISRVGSQWNSTLRAVGSWWSVPWIASKTMAQSSTLRQIGPSLSIDHESAIAPVRGTRPNVGRRPVVPQRVEGDEIDPSVSEPIANATQPAATAEHDPADEPDEPWSSFHGFRVRSPNHK